MTKSICWIPLRMNLRLLCATKDVERLILAQGTYTTIFDVTWEKGVFW